MNFEVRLGEAWLGDFHFQRVIDAILLYVLERQLEEIETFRRGEEGFEATFEIVGVVDEDDEAVGGGGWRGWGWLL